MFFDQGASARIGVIIAAKLRASRAASVRSNFTAGSAAMMKVVAFIVDPPVIRKILEHHKGLAHGPPRPSAAPTTN